MLLQSLTLLLLWILTQWRLKLLFITKHVVWVSRTRFKQGLEETYEALKTFEILGIEKKPEIRLSACASVVDTLLSTSSALKDFFYALKVNSILKCELNDEAFRGTESRLKDSLNGVKSLLDFYYSVGGLVLIKDETSEVDVQLEVADKFFK